MSSSKMSGRKAAPEPSEHWTETPEARLEHAALRRSATLKHSAMERSKCECSSARNDQRPATWSRKYREAPDTLSEPRHRSIPSRRCQRFTLAHCRVDTRAMSFERSDIRIFPDRGLPASRQTLARIDRICFILKRQRPNP